MKVFKRRFYVGRWQLTPEVILDPWALSVGIDARMLSWRSFYPWLRAGVFLGPVSCVLDITRPLGSGGLDSVSLAWIDR